MSRAAIALYVNEVVTIMKPVEVEDKISKSFEEWQQLKQQLAILNLVAEKIGGRITEIEVDIKDVTKGAANQQVQIDDTIVYYKTRNNTSVSYMNAFNKALEIVTDEQRKFLNDFKETVTSKSVTESLKIEDPKLAQYLQNLKMMDASELISQLDKIKNIPVPPKKNEGVVDFAKGLLQKAKSSLRKLFLSLKPLQRATDNLARVARSE